MFDTIEQKPRYRDFQKKVDLYSFTWTEQKETLLFEEVQL